MNGPATTTQFYLRSSDAWDAMLVDLEKAAFSIDFEQYIFTLDEIGRKFIKIFIEKAKAGVRIRLLMDMVGSSSFYRSGVPDELRRQGIEVRFFNPVSLWRITNYSSSFFRDHRKMLIVDNKIGQIGGVGIEADMAFWRDTHMRIEGPLVEDLRESFEMVWATVKRGTFAKTGAPHQYVKNFSLLTNSPRLGQRHIYQTLLSNIRNAQSYIYLTTPYFIPDVPLFRILRLAAKRGVDVRIILPSIADHIFVDHARESYFSLALKAGIKIYAYQPAMMHAKTAVIDDIWATAGSFNLDSLSFVFNHEANISSSDSEFIASVKSAFLADLGECREVKYEEWIRRPLRKKFKELLTWPFHGIM